MPAILLWSNGFLINIFHDLVSGWLNAEYSSAPEKRFPLLLGVICIKIPFCLSFSLSSHVYHLHRGSKKYYENGSFCLVILTIFLLVMQAAECHISSDCPSVALPFWFSSVPLKLQPLNKHIITLHGFCHLAQECRYYEVPNTRRESKASPVLKK